MKERYIKSIEDIFDLIDDNETIVVPTEVAARSIATSYVESRRKPILASSILEFKAFKDKLFEIPKNKRKVDDLDKSLFVSWFCSNKSSELKYFIKDEKYKELEDNLSSTFISAINDYKSIVENQNTIKIPELQSDLTLLQEEYSKYLDNLGLYDESMLVLKEENIPSNINLLFLDTTKKGVDLIKKISKSDINILKPVEDINGELRVYDNEKKEIRWLFTEIRKLIEDGVTLDRIAISTSALDRIKPYLEQEAKLFSVDLEFSTGDKLTKVPYGEFLKAISTIYREGYLLSDLKSFFMNPLFNFVDKEKISSFIYKAINFNIYSAKNYKDDRYKKITYGKDSFDYKKFRDYVDSINREVDPDQLRMNLKGLTRFLFGDNAFEEENDSRLSYLFIRSQLERFIDKLKEEGFSNNYSLNKPILPLFLNYAERKEYVRKDRKNGIRVYPFSEAVATVYDYHFLITLNDKETAKTTAELSFLSEYEREGVEDVELTKKIINSYMVMNKHIYLSTSKETYSGAALPVVSLLDRKDDNPYFPDFDAYRVEDSKDRKEKEIKIYETQKNGYINGLKTSFMPEIKERVGVKEDENPLLSHTSFEEYKKCPFKYALLRKYGLKDPQIYDENSNYDSLEIGNVIHSIFQQYYLWIINNHPHDFDSVYKETMDNWLKGKTFKYLDLDKGIAVYNDIEKGKFIPTPSFVAYVTKVHKENMRSIISEIYEDRFTPVAVEEKLDAVKDDYNLTGRIDLVLKDENGKIIIIDFKTGNPKVDEDKKEQIIMYGLLEKEHNNEAKEGYFKHTKQRDKSKTERVEIKKEDMDNLEAKVKEYTLSLKEGDWHQTEDYADCKKCEFKSICRRKIIVR